jgi:DHA1 family multidrug resistance protein-like MFS transporter
VEIWRRTLYLTWFTQILSLVGFGFVLPFLPFYIQEMGVTDPAELRAWVGAVSAAPALLMGVMGPIWGKAADRFGARLMLLRATLAGFLLLFSLGLARTVQMVLALRIIQGLFSGTITASATLVAAGTPKNRLSFALGFLGSSTFIGLSLGPSLGGLSAEWLGFRPTFFIGSGLLLLDFFLVLFTIPDVRGEKAKRPTQERGEGAHFSLRAAFRPPFLLLFLVFFALRFARSLPFPFLPLYIQELRGSVEGASALTGGLAALTGVVTAASGLTLTRLGDRYNRLVLLALLAGGGALLAYPIYLLTATWGFVTFYLLTAFALGATQPLLESHMSSAISRETRGMLFGIEALVGSLGWFAAPLVGSAVTIAFGLKSIFLAYALTLSLAFVVAATQARKRLRTLFLPARRLRHFERRPER